MINGGACSRDFPHLLILGSRGIPARHGGFETFAERLALYLVSRGWRVTVYCQETGRGAIRESTWRDICLVHVPVPKEGAGGTMWFDWRAIWHAKRETGVILTLGYNTALFSVLHRLFGQRLVINMDGVEWRRGKWGPLAKLWLWVNERAGGWFGNVLIADHPEIARYLASKYRRGKICMIPYGGDGMIGETDVRDGSLWLEQHGVPNDLHFGLIVARPEPENSILEIVQGFSSRFRGARLIVLGCFRDDIQYHRQVRQAASDEVVFVGAHYDKGLLTFLRTRCRVYFHGHRVGGTNPSLVESMAASSLVAAHDNIFNRWVLGKDGLYFSDVPQVMELCDRLFGSLDPGVEEEIARRRAAARTRCSRCFRWDAILARYELVLGGDMSVPGGELEPWC